MNCPLVTVVIPTYKNRGGLINSIESVLLQSYPNIEIIVVDDNGIGSNDQIHTQQLLKNLISETKIIYISHEYNKNGAAARNTGISHAKGKYIAFLDDDDLFKEQKILKQVSFLENNSNYDAVYNQCEQNGHIIDRKLKEGDLTLDLLFMNTHMFTPSLMFTRKSLLTINGFDESFRRHQDYELMLRFFELGYIIGAINESLTIIGNNGGENSLKGKNLEDLKNKFLKKYDRLIAVYSDKRKSIKQNIYARHFAAVFISYIKEKKVLDASRILFNYGIKSPSYFFKPIICSIVNRLFC